jgi:hypothetical protein
MTFLRSTYLPVTPGTAARWGALSSLVGGLLGATTFLPSVLRSVPEQGERRGHRHPDGAGEFRQPARARPRDGSLHPGDSRPVRHAGRAFGPPGRTRRLWRVACRSVCGLPLGALRVHNCWEPWLVMAAPGDRHGRLRAGVAVGGDERLQGTPVRAPAGPAAGRRLAVAGEHRPSPPVGQVRVALAHRAYYRRPALLRCGAIRVGNAHVLSPRCRKHRAW